MSYMGLVIGVFTLFLSTDVYSQNMVDKFTRLVDLESKDNQEALSNVYFSYNLAVPDRIEVGQNVITPNNFKIRVVKVKDIYEFDTAEKVDDSILEQKLFLYKYPKSFFKEAAAQLEYSIKYKEKIISFKLDRQTNDEISLLKESIKSLNGRLKETTDTINGKLAYNGYFLLDDDAPEISEITFCIREGHKDSLQLGTMACLESVAAHIPTVTINGEIARTIDSVKVAEETAFNWVGQNSNFRLEINTVTPKVRILDVLAFKKNLFKVTAEGALPLQPVRIVPQPEQLLPEVGERLPIWTTEVKKTNPRLNFTGQGGGTFEYPVEIGSAVNEQYIFLEKSDLGPTYLSQKIIHGRKSNGLTLSSETGKFTYSSKGKLLSPFKWQVELPLVGKSNEITISALTQSSEKKTYKVSLDRAYPGDVSLRGGFTRAANSDFISVAELTGSYWFERFLNLESKTFFQRFGVTARYLIALSKYPTSTAANSEVSLAQTNLGLRMRTNSGIWGRDSGGGFSFEYQDFMLDSVSFPSLGVGAFWAMPIPSFLSSSFDQVSHLRYPKWLDFEAVYYPVSMKSDFSMKPTFNVNLTTKFAMSQRTFGDIGLSYRSYNYQMEQAETKLSASYFVLGIGTRF